jgi:quercetin dioxygenase-like cupin family protein
MATRRNFIQQGSMGLASTFLLPLTPSAVDYSDFGGLVVSDEEGEVFQIRGGTAILRIKIAKTQGAQSMSFLSESFRPGDRIPVHKHLNEDELIFLHKGTGLFTLGDKEFEVKPGAVALVPKGIWHGLQNTGSENIEMRFSYTPSGFEGFFREAGTPGGQPYVQKTTEQRNAIRAKWGIVYKD